MRRTPKSALMLVTLAASAVLTSGSAFGETRIGQGLRRGGVSTDASAIFTPSGDDSSTFHAGPDLAIVMPTDAAVQRSYLLVAAQYFGFQDANAVADSVRLNGVLLSSATLVEYESAQPLPYMLFDVTAGFGIDGTGSYSIEESAAAEGDPGSYVGITGHQLIVQWESPTAPWTLVDAWVGHASANQTVSLAAPPACSGSPGAILSVGLGWECAGEQNNTLFVTSNGATDTVSTVLGGGDDASAPTPCDSNGAALYTAGSFGFDETGPVGVDGDDYATEPGDGSGSNNRLSDELFLLTPPTYELVDSLGVLLGGDDNEAVHALVIAHGVADDFDCDGFDNDVDVCPALADDGQEDLDADGVGDVCDDDDDGDGALDEVDNCPAIDNAGQEDLDADDLGDVCDDDDDGDGVDDSLDNCPVDPNPAQEDADGDDIGDACDPTGQGGAGGGTSGSGGSGAGAGGGAGQGGAGEGGTASNGGSGGSTGDGAGGPGATSGAGATTSTGATPSGAGASGGTGGDEDSTSGGDASADDGGCTMAAAGARPQRSWLLLGLGALAVATGRRRRR